MFLVVKGNHVVSTVFKVGTFYTTFCRTLIIPTPALHFAFPFEMFCLTEPCNVGRTLPWKQQNSSVSVTAVRFTYLDS